MHGPWTPELPKTLRRFFLFSFGLATASACDAGPPTAVGRAEAERVGLVLAIDTLDVEVQRLWIRVSAVPAVRQDLVLTWELEAVTGNPFWRPKVVRQAGRKRFQSPDTARLWGNVPRAYDFRLVAAGRTPAGDFASDTLVVRAPPCRSNQPSLLCNVGTSWPELRGSLHTWRSEFPSRPLLAPRVPPVFRGRPR